MSSGRCLHGVVLFRWCLGLRGASVAPWWCLNRTHADTRCSRCLGRSYLGVVLLVDVGGVDAVGDTI